MDWDEYLREAWRDGDKEQIRYALEQGADPNVDLYDDLYGSLLCWAASGKDVDFVHLLLRAGAKVARESQAESTSVHEAVEQNQREILELLLAADGAVALNWFDYVARTPLMIAVRENNQELAQLLLEAGADINAHDEARAGNTALHIAAGEGNSHMVKFLLKAGADPLMPGGMQLTPWHKAQQRRSPEGLKVRELIENALPSPQRPGSGRRGRRG